MGLAVSPELVNLRGRQTKICLLAGAIDVPWGAHEGGAASSRLPENFLSATGKFSGSWNIAAAFYCAEASPASFQGAFQPSGCRSMVPHQSGCAILADRHTELTERVRDLLEADFETVYIVSDAASLREGATQLTPDLIVLDLSLAGGRSERLLGEISSLSPRSKVIVLSVHDEAVIVRMALGAGAHGVVLKQSIGADFQLAVSAVLRGEPYVSSGFGWAAAT
jgi:CheY-like chemotaxis protein